MIIGFTGTGDGMTSRQLLNFSRRIIYRSPTEFHHGDCVGADQQAHEMVRLNVPNCKIIIHPPENRTKRAWCKGDVVLPVKPYLARNLDIVLSCVELIAAPRSHEEELRSGTWATVRYARKAQKPIHMVWP